MSNFCTTKSDAPATFNLIEGFDYRCSNRLCDNRHVNIYLESESGLLLTPEYVYRALWGGNETTPLPPLTVEYISCAGCNTVVPANYLPERIISESVAANRMELVLTTPKIDDNRPGKPNVNCIYERGPGDDALFKCPRCLHREVEVRLEKHCRHNSGTCTPKQTVAAMKHTYVVAAVCRRCHYKFRDAQFPEEIHVKRGSVRWRINVCFGPLAPCLDVGDWESAVADIERYAHCMVALGRHEEARRTIRHLVIRLRSACDDQQWNNAFGDRGRRLQSESRMSEWAYELERCYLVTSLPRFNLKQCVEITGCPLLAAPEGSWGKPDCFPWNGGRCLLKEKGQLGMCEVSPAPGADACDFRSLYASLHRGKM